MGRTFRGEQFRQQFVFVHRQTGDAGLIAVEPDSPTDAPELGLSFVVERGGHPVGLAVLTDRHALVGLAREILRTLDPVTNEQLLEKIENLVAPQNTSELE